MITHDILDIFGTEGRLAAGIQGFRHRPQQETMAQAVAEAITEHEVLVVEAGTGTGKTFAYLAPAMLYGGKVIVSTGTKTLQDQLFFKDLPALSRALGQPLSIALLKGRSNYICLHRMKRAEEEGLVYRYEDKAHLGRIRRFAERGGDGDRAGVLDVPETSAVWPHVTSTRDNCLGQDCPDFKECFLVDARRRAMAADLVVVNHHLFFADLALKDEGFGEILPSCNTVIFDEAHQLADVATLFFSHTLSSGQVLELSRDLRGEAHLFAADAPAVQEMANGLERAAGALRAGAGGERGRQTSRSLLGRAAFVAALDDLADRLTQVHGLAASQEERSDDLKRCGERAVELRGRLDLWRGEDDEWVRWGEAGIGMALHASPVSVAHVFAPQMAQGGRSWIFTSATIALGQDFSHFCRDLGLEDCRTLEVGSPFDYERQGLLYVPSGLPEPNTPGYTAAVVEAALPVLRASRGRAFLLFTSLAAMRQAHGLLAEAFAGEGLGFTLLLQGDAPKSELLGRFRSAKAPVLVASQSFWEGVDVPGDALTVVLIDKLPFTPPDDPLLQARGDRLRQQGGNPFVAQQLPQAAISLKQGAGRLIRAETDMGVLVLCDPRLYGKSYGRVILGALPPMRRTRREVDAVDFLEALA